MRVIVAGKRDFFDTDIVYKELEAVFKEIGMPDMVIEGGAAGVDTIARQWAEEHHIPLTEIPADWKLYGRSAGPVRNGWMAECACEDPDAHLVAFWDGRSRGTGNMIRVAKQRGIKIHIVSLP